MEQQNDPMKVRNPEDGADEYFQRIVDRLRRDIEGRRCDCDELPKRDNSRIKNNAMHHGYA